MVRIKTLVVNLNRLHKLFLIELQVFLVQVEVLLAHRTGLVVRKPGVNALAVKDVVATQKAALAAVVYCFKANGAFINQEFARLQADQNCFDFAVSHFFVDIRQLWRRKFRFLACRCRNLVLICVLDRQSFCGRM